MFYNKYFYSFLFYVVVHFSYSQSNQISKCINNTVSHTLDGVTTEYPCDNYDLLARIPVAVLANNLGEGTNKPPAGSDIWGWTDPETNKEYAIIGMTNSTAFVDVSDPLNPIFLGRINSTNDEFDHWRDVKIFNNHAFIVADSVGNHGMQVFDLTRLRNGVALNLTFTPDTTYFGDTNTGDPTNSSILIESCHNIVINEATGIAYLVGCSDENGGVIFVDINDPTNPNVVGSYSESYTHDAQVVTYNGPDQDYTGKEILIGSNGSYPVTVSNKIIILDVTNKSNPTLIKEFNYLPTAGYTHQGWFTENQRYFLLGDELDEQTLGNKSRTLIFDFNDLDNPVLHFDYKATFDAIDHNGYVKGNKFYLANYRAGTRIFDISDISSTTDPMTEIGYFDSYPEDNDAEFNGVWSIYPYFNSKNIIISDIERGLFIVRESNSPLNVSNNNNEQSFSVYPNPTTDAFTVIANKAYPINNLKIYNISGQLILHQEDLNINSKKINMNNLSRGLYLLKINNSITKKIIKL